MLISFEGIDGCGKTTQIELLKNYFKKNKITYYVFREPGGTELSEKIRSLLLHEAGEIDPVTELLLFSSARSQLISEKVIPILKKGEIVILDRFYDSTTAYQGYGRGSSDIEHINTLNKIASHNTIPDLTFYLKIDPDLANKRTAQNQKDRMESSGREFFSKVCSGYDEIAKNEDRFIVLDATLTPDEIHQQILNQINTHFSTD